MLYTQGVRSYIHREASHRGCCRLYTEGVGGYVEGV